MRLIEAQDVASDEERSLKISSEAASPSYTTLSVPRPAWCSTASMVRGKPACDLTWSARSAVATAAFCELYPLPSWFCTKPARKRILTGYAGRLEACAAAAAAAGAAAAAAGTETTASEAESDSELWSRLASDAKPWARRLANTADRWRWRSSASRRRPRSALTSAPSSSLATSCASSSLIV